MKRAPEIDAAMREVAQRRDQALSEVTTLPSTRRRTLTGFLARQFPVETAAREVALKRDHALYRSPAKMPAAVDSVLRRQLTTARPKSSMRRAATWLDYLRSPLAAALIACALLTGALFGLGRREPSRRNVSHLPAPLSFNGISLDSGMELFTRTAAIGPFNLNTNEPASLQASFLANRRIRSADGNDTPLGLRLDLPVKAALMEDGLARTP